MKGQPITYSKREMDWLEVNRDLVISDYYRAFQEAFPRPDVSSANLHALRKRKGWKVGRAKGRLAGRNCKYSPEELAWLEERQDWPRATLHSVFCALFERQDVTVEKIKALCTRKGMKTGRTGCFAKGHVSANKGQPCPEGTGGRHPNARRTQFKKGGRYGRAVKSYQPIGTERLREDGYVYRKINDDMPLQKRWRQVHVIEWEAIHGPIPKGHCLKSLDGNTLNTDPSNWELVHRAVLLRLNGGPNGRHLAYDAAAPEVRPALIAIAKVDHQARQLIQKPKAGVAA